MFAGQPGKLFLGAMGFLFLVAIISGVVLYWPFTRRLSFGTLRDKSRRIAWFDWHNLLGAITIAWALVVGATGVINTLRRGDAEPVEGQRTRRHGQALCRQAAAGASGLA